MEVFYIKTEDVRNCDISRIKHRNSLQGNYTPEVPRQMVEKWRNLDSVFYTVDFAEMEDGSWKIIEVGDGSVSGLSDGQNYESFFRKLFICCNEAPAEV